MNSRGILLPSSTSTSTVPTILLPPPVKQLPYLPCTITWTPDMVVPNFYNYKDVFPYLQPLLEAVPGITQEMLRLTSSINDLSFPSSVIRTEEENKRIPSNSSGTATTSSVWHDWPETSLFRPDHGHEWKVVPICYTFPADDPSKTVWLDSPAVNACPYTVAWLKSIPGIRTALFSRLGCNTSLTSHTGWAALSNHVLRCHLPLIVPGKGGGSIPPLHSSNSNNNSNNNNSSSNSGTVLSDTNESYCCGVVVNDEIQYHQVGNMLVFDDSKVHAAFNHHTTEPRIVLIFDIERPKQVAPGSATGETTVELEGFMKQFH